MSPQQRRFIIAPPHGGNLWLQFTAFIISLGKHAASTATPERHRHIVPLFDCGSSALDGVTNELRGGCKWNVSVSAFMITDIKHESQPPSRATALIFTLNR